MKLFGITQNDNKAFDTFKNTSNSVQKRFKGMGQHIAQLRKLNNADVDKFYNEKSSMILELCNQLLLKYSDNTLKKSKYNFSEEVKNVLTQIVDVLESLDKDKLSAINPDFIYNTIYQCLCIHNRHDTRKIGLKLMFYYLDRFNTLEEIEKEAGAFTNLFKGVLYYNLITKIQQQEERKEYFQKIIGNAPNHYEVAIAKDEDCKCNCSKAAVWIKWMRRENTGAAYTSDEINKYNEDMMMLFFEMLSYSNKQKMWYEMFKKHWFKIFYPQIYYKYAKIDPSYGSIATCPLDIQSFILKMFKALLYQSKNNLSNIIFDSVDDIHLLLDVVKQPLRELPTSHDSFKSYDKLGEIRDIVIFIYRNFLHGNGNPTAFESNRDEFMPRLIKDLFSVYHKKNFFADHSEDFCRKVQILLTDFLNKIYSYHNKEIIWEYFYKEILLALQSLYKHLKTQLIDFRNASMNTFNTTPRASPLQSKEFGFSALDKSQNNEVSERQGSLIFDEKILSPLFKFLLEMTYESAIQGCEAPWSLIEKSLKVWIGNYMFQKIWFEVLEERTKSLLNVVYGEHRLPEYKKMFESPYEYINRSKEIKPEYIFQILFDVWVLDTKGKEYLSKDFSGYKFAIYQERLSQFFSLDLYATFKNWKSLINVVGAIRSIEDPKVIQKILKTYSTIVKMLIRVNQVLETAPNSTIHIFPPPTTTLFNIFGNYFFDICDLDGAAYTKVKCVAYKAISMILCQTKSEIPLSKYYLAICIRLIKKGVSAAMNIKVVSKIIKHCTRIFILDYPGIYMLLSPFMSSLTRILLTSECTDYVIKQAAIQIIGSLISYSYTFDSFKPVITAHEDSRELKGILKEMLSINLANSCLVMGGVGYIEYIQKSLCCLTVLFFQEFTLVDKNTASSKFCEEILVIILSTLDHESYTIKQIAVSCINSLAILFKEMYNYNKGLICSIYKQLVSTIEKHITMIIKDGSLSKQTITFLSKLFECITEFIIEDRFKLVLTHKDILQPILIILDEASTINNSEIKDILDQFLMHLVNLYENYPARGQKNSVSNSMINEMEFLKASRSLFKSLNYTQRSFRFNDFNINGFLDNENDELDVSEHVKTETLPNKKENEDDFFINISSKPRKDTLFIKSITGLLDRAEEIDDQNVAQCQKRTSTAPNSKRPSSRTSFNASPSKQLENMLRKNSEDEDNESERSNFFTKTIHYVYKDKCVFSAVKSFSNISKILVRDNLGKHAWYITHHRALDNDCLNNTEYSDKYTVFNNMITLSGQELSLQQISTESSNSSSLAGVGSDVHKPVNLAAPVHKTPVFKPSKDLTASAHTVDTFEMVIEHNEDNPVYLVEEELSEDVDERDDKDEKGEKEEESKDDDRLANLFKALMEEYVELSELATTKSLTPKTFANEQEIMKLISNKNYEMQEALHTNSHNYEYFVKNQVLSTFSKAFRYAKRFDENENMAFDTFRSFMSHFGFLNTKMAPIEKVSDYMRKIDQRSQQFIPLINILDRDIKYRETFKIGVLYVDPNQTTQKEILFNSKGSSLYEEFIDSLGRVIDLNTHQGYQGSLTSYQSGNNALYYATAVNEIIFHVTTMMPTNDNDQQQITKKKYVGNDAIHIIWCENMRDYRAGTISGAFNFAHIVIYPLKNKLYRINIIKKDDKVRFFGPLMDGMVISQEILPTLVRLTAINACKSLNVPQLERDTPYKSRMSIIKNKISKERMVKNDDHVEDCKISLMYLFGDEK